MTSPTLPTDAQTRKALPVFSGVLRYFPDALTAVAECSKKGNDQHNPGKPLHWDRSKSQDELDALTRHLLDAGTIDTDGIRHSTKVAWRALANLQKEIEAARQLESAASDFGLPDHMKEIDDDVRTSATPPAVFQPQDADPEFSDGPEYAGWEQRADIEAALARAEIGPRYCSGCRSRCDGCASVCLYGGALTLDTE